MGIDDANFDDEVGELTDVGTYSDDASYYGTFDQSGNIWERSDTIVANDTTRRIARGGEFSGGENDLKSSKYGNLRMSTEADSIGFRVTSLAPIPEPSTYATIFGSLALAVAMMRRKGRRTL